MLAAIAAIALLLVTVAVLGLGVALAFAGVLGAVLANGARRDTYIEVPARLGFATIALLGLLIFALATIGIVPQL